MTKRTVSGKFLEQSDSELTCVFLVDLCGYWMPCAFLSNILDASLLNPTLDSCLKKGLIK